MSLLLPGLICAFAAYGADEGDPFEVELAALSDNVWSVHRPRPERQPVMGNGAIIINSDHVVVVDGNGSPLFAERVIAQIRQLTPLPVRYLVVTHWHGDHNLGNSRFLDQWPDLVIIGHEFTRAAMLGEPMNYVVELRQTLGPQITHLRNIAATGKLPDGSEVPRHLRADFFDLSSYGDLILDELERSEVTAPTKTFRDALVLKDGGRTIEVHHFGRGNTAGDAVVWLPASRILIAGDTVVAPTPFGFGSYPRSWSRVLEQFRGLQPRFLVPGHGPVQESPRYVERLIAMLELIADGAEKAVDAGLGPSTFAQHFDWEGHPLRFHQNDPTLKLRFEEWFAKPILKAAHNEASGIDNEPLEASVGTP